MAEISKISAVAIANVAKVDAVTKANIADINGLTIPSAGFLLDTYTGAAAAYSVRRLATATTVLLRVRRDTAGGTGDDDEADVAYDSNNILSLDSAISNASAGVTATTLGQFINVGTVNGTTYTNPDSLAGTASCYVDTWYDQASTNDAVQDAEGSQPQIHDGTVNTDLITENGKPAVSFDGSNDELRSGVRLSVTAISVTTVQKFDSTAGGQVSVNPSEAAGSQLYMPYNNPSGTFTYNYRTIMRTSTATTNQMAADVFMNDQAGTDVVQFFENGTQVGSDIAQGIGTSVNDLTLGNYSGGGFNADCHIQEVIVWEAGMEDDRTGIQKNVNDHFSIY